MVIYNHMARGGKAKPTGKWKGLVELPNTVSKMTSMKDQVETPLTAAFSGRAGDLEKAGKSIGGRCAGDKEATADLAPFPPCPAYR